MPTTCQSPNTVPKSNMSVKYYCSGFVNAYTCSLFNLLFLSARDLSICAITMEKAIVNNTR